MDRKTKAAALPYFKASVIARVLGVGTKRVHRLARREKWPAKRNGLRVAYSPPQSVAQKCGETAPPSYDRGCLLIDLRRAFAVYLVVTFLKNNPAFGREMAADRVALQMEELNLKPKQILDWLRAAERGGLVALMSARRGRRKAATA